MTRSVGVAYLLFALLILVSASFVSAEDRIYQTESEAHAAALEAAQLDLQKQIYKARVDSVTPMDIYLTTQWKLRDQVQDVMSEAIVAQESSAEEGQVVVILEVPIDSIPLRIRGFYREYGLYVRGQGVALCPRTRTTMPDLDSSQFVWQDQILSAMGEGKARDDTSDTEGLQQAFHAARAEAMRNLGAMMESLSLSGDRTLRDLISTNQAVRYRVHSLIGRATPTKVDFVSEDVCQVTLELPLSLLPAALAVESASEEAAEDARLVQAKALARRNAQQIAYRKLARTLYDIPVKANLTIRDYAARDARLAQDLENTLHNAEVVREKLLRDGTFQVEVALDVARLPRKVSKAAQAQLGARYVVTATGRPE